MELLSWLAKLQSCTTCHRWYFPQQKELQTSVSNQQNTPWTCNMGRGCRQFIFAYDFQVDKIQPAHMNVKHHYWKHIAINGLMIIINNVTKILGIFTNKFWLRNFPICKGTCTEHHQRFLVDLKKIHKGCSQKFLRNEK